jgi:hypothetical protein
MVVYLWMNPKNPSTWRLYSTAQGVSASLSDAYDPGNPDEEEGYVTTITGTSGITNERYWNIQPLDVNSSDNYFGIIPDVQVGSDYYKAFYASFAFSFHNEGMKAMYDDAYKSADDEGKAALEELLAYEEGIVPEEYKEPQEVRSALALSGFVTETWRYEILNFADKYADAGGQIYDYLWTVPSTLDQMYKSAVHAIELAYVFNNLEDDIYAGEVDKPTAEKAQESWTNYAKTGDPSIEGVEWLKYDTTDRYTMVINKDKWECVSDPSKEAREFMTKVYGDEPYSLW